MVLYKLRYSIIEISAKTIRQAVKRESFVVIFKYEGDCERR